MNDKTLTGLMPGASELADPLASAPPLNGHAGGEPPGFRRKAALSLAALGVVYGDIGTSPLYAMRESALAAEHHVSVQLAIMGVASLIVWSLIIVVTLKYVVLIMRADNEGEGGILALASIAHRTQGFGAWAKIAIGMIAVLGLALFFGDGMLTPAISVLSAVEGLSVESKTFEPLVLPLALAILVALFAIQSRGTSTVGKVFGPVMVVWFVVLGALGLESIVRTPQILFALNPYYGFDLFVREPWTAFVTLGAVVLAVTGCETLYADMGHFGKFPIRFAWLAFVFPALVLNYFGQGAALLRHPSDAAVAFYAIAPHWAHYPLVALATVASIIASQAVISGVYSITNQAVQLGLLPRMEIRHTSATDFGQIYVPRMNAYLCIGVVLIVMIFKSSNALAAAYGIAVTGIMVFSTALVGIVAVKQWGWRRRYVYPVFGVLALVDLAFISSNALKIFEGGWLPLLIAAFVFVVMETWRLGRHAQFDRLRVASMPVSLFLERLSATPVRVSGTAAFLTANADLVPGALLHNLKHNRVLHERVLIVQVVVEDVPTVPRDRRVKVENLGKGFYSVHVYYGFFETPDLPKALAGVRELAIEPLDTTYFIGRETLVPAESPKLSHWRMWLYTQLASNALSPARHYHLTPNRVVELGTQVVI